MGFWGDIMSEDDGFGKKVAENDQWILWVNSMTKIYQDKVDNYDSSGFTLRGLYTVVLGQNKQDDTRTYLLMNNETGRPYANWDSPEEFDFKITMITRDLIEDCDVVNMAERRLEE